MKQVRHRRRSRPIALSALVAVVASMVVAASPAQAAPYDGLLTDNVVEINETVSDAGFVHPGVAAVREALAELDADEQALAQRLHLNGTDYRAWTDLLKPHLEAFGRTS